MEPGAKVDDTDDIQAQVLQTTLAEIETSRQQVASSDGGDTEQQPPNCCVICLDSISDPCAALPCTHAHFDFLCLVSWLEQHPNCPLCKANVYKVRYADAQGAEAVYRVPNATRTRDSTGSNERPGGQSRRTDIDSASRRRFTSRNGLLQERSSRRHPRAPPTPDEAIQRRRHIYRHNLYSLHVGSNRFSQYRSPPTPIQFSSTPHLVSRARLWLRRELQVFSFLSDPDPDPNLNPATDSNTQDQTRRRRSSNAEFLLEYIVAILKTVDIQGSAGQAEAMLADFLGREHARLILHELRSWLRSPAQGLAAWDREVQYPEPGSGSGFGPRRGYEEEEEEEEDGVGRGDRRRKRGDDTPVEGEGDERGRSWRDRGGDHWRAGGPAMTGDRRKRKWRETGEQSERDERVNRPRRDMPAGH